MDKGKKANAWKGGSKSTDSNRARDAWEKHWGKKVPKGFIVHHADGNPENNHISNLKLMRLAQSNKIHKKGKTLNQQEHQAKNKPNKSDTEKPQRRFR